jgi:hypothetical protein
MVVHHREAAGWPNAAEPSAVMQRRVYHVLQEWTNEPHRSVGL